VKKQDEVMRLLYLQLKARAVIKPGEQLLVRHIADALDARDAQVMDLPVACTKNEGVWRLPAMALVKAVIGVCPDLTVLGPAECFVHVVPESKRSRTHALRTALAFLILTVGSALAITWFHADVNMMDAQQSLYRLITGRQAENAWLITAPYAAGVFMGVSLYYALLGRKRTVAPLEIKLEEYRQSAEQVSGLTP
jgi:stage V sporulation protein AA